MCIRDRFHVENRLVTNPLDIMKNELFLQDPYYNEMNGIMETEKVRFHEWLNGVMFSEKEVKTCLLYTSRCV